MTPIAGANAPVYPVFNRFSAPLALLGRALAPPALRVTLALPFLRSGLTRWDPFPHLSIATQFLFSSQFKLHLLGRLVDLPAPIALAWVTATAEIALPTLLIFGLATRPAALGLLAMTGVIQLIVPDGWANYHLYWAALALALLALGAGPLSLDALIGRVAGCARGKEPATSTNDPDNVNLPRPCRWRGAAVPR